MAWKKSEEIVPGLVLQEELLKKEAFWVSGYNEPERWAKDLASCHYSLDGEYDLDEDKTLYRFKFDEDFRAEYLAAAHFQNVLISKSVRTPKVAVIAEVAVERCKTCGK